MREVTLIQTRNLLIARIKRRKCDVHQKVAHVVYNDDAKQPEFIHLN